MRPRLLLLLVLFPLSVAQGQRLKQSVEPTFRIEPIVQRFDARRGEVIPFQYGIASLGRDMEVSVEVVGLRQEETGVILHDTVKKASDAVELTSPATVRLAPGDLKVIAGKVTVPLARSNFLSYGLLVRELTAAPQFEQVEEKTKTQVGVKFVTQYVLRLDIETGVADVGEMNRLRLERGTIVSERGLPRLRTYLHNPTNFAYECYVNARVAGLDEKRSRPIRMATIGRLTRDAPERYLVRILPGSTLRLEAPIDKPLALGDQTLTLGVSSGRREVVTSEFAVHLDAKDFPALARDRAVIGDGVIVSPAQLELGSTSGAGRTLALKVQNTTDGPMAIDLAPSTLAGDPLASVRLSPASFTIKPGRTKNVRVMLRRQAGAASASGLVRVATRTETGVANEAQLPLSVLHTAPEPPQVSLSPIAWQAEPRGDGFVVQVTNNGTQYVPVDAQLAALGPGGLRLRLEDGFGMWLAPGASRDLLFRPAGPLPAGEYRLALAVKTRDDVAPIVRELKVQLAGGTTTASTSQPTPGTAESRG